MPKKFQGVNTKAAEARARKANASAAAQETKAKAMEDEYWKDDDKHVNKKAQRKQAQEQKRISNLTKKKELDELYQAEENELKKITKTSTSSTKMTRAEIDNMRKNEQKQKLIKQEQEALKKKNVSQQSELSENINHVIAADSSKNTIEARSVEEAISALSTSDELERHPERRMKAAYKKYEEEQLPLLKAGNPGLKMSQIRQLLHKQWQKSPDNPLNQKHSSYNAK